MNKLNIKEYKTKSGEMRYILRGAYIGTDVLTGKQIKTDIRGERKQASRMNLNALKMNLKRMVTPKVKNHSKLLERLLRAFLNFISCNKKLDQYDK